MLSRLENISLLTDIHVDKLQSVSTSRDSTTVAVLELSPCDLMRQLPVKYHLQNGTILVGVLHYLTALSCTKGFLARWFYLLLFQYN